MYLCACVLASLIHLRHVWPHVVSRCFMSIGWIPSKINGCGQITPSLPRSCTVCHSRSWLPHSQSLHKSRQKWTPQSFRQWIICVKKVLSHCHPEMIRSPREPHLNQSAKLGSVGPTKWLAVAGSGSSTVVISAGQPRAVGHWDVHKFDA